MVKCSINFSHHDFEFLILFNFSVASYGNNFYAFVLHSRDVWKKSWGKNMVIPKFQ